uniref:Ovule protein n=1 Tax=Ascaris lumbricoides TaxID=6252 RepID=A0A0M3HME1_ASCLU
MQRIEKQLEVLSSREENVKVEEGDDELDTFCKHLQQSTSGRDNIDVSFSVILLSVIIYHYFLLSLLFLL